MDADRCRRVVSTVVESIGARLVDGSTRGLRQQLDLLRRLLQASVDLSPRVAWHDGARLRVLADRAGASFSLAELNRRAEPEPDTLHVARAAPRLHVPVERVSIGQRLARRRGHGGLATERDAPLACDRLDEHLAPGSVWSSAIGTREPIGDGRHHL